ncbi:nuclear transport factor 2 family protein [Actinophytocola sp. NPDC049390]|uniref:nuclear transport factor 2 family protein n=1 Tax=Actinophytocola sp. NPDC049390 TaxID=3363894 RepID=UPI00379EC439
MTVADFRQAAATKDIDLAMASLADGVVLHSPLTDRFTFNGKDEVRRLFETAYERFDGLSYDLVIGDGERRVLVGGGTAGGQPFEETLLLTVDDREKITEIALFIRPLPGLTAVMAALGPALAHRNGRSRLAAGVLRAMTAPLVAATRFGDRVGIKLALPRGQRG